MAEEANLESMPSVELVGLVQRGEQHARDELFARYGPRVLEIARIRLGRRLRTHVDSVDVLQDVLADAVRGLEGFEMRDDSSLIRWLSRMVENRLRGLAAHYGAAKRDPARVVALDSSTASETRPAIDVSASGRLPSPSVEVGREEEADQVRACLAELPERHRETILLRDYECASWEEVARVMGAPSPAAARMLHSRALARLGRLLRERGVD